jgi:hypothetical protein
MIALIGSEGSMGRRYQAIFNHLKVPYLALDRTRPDADQIIKKAIACDRALIATPTETHVEYLRALLPFGKPILCEKPVCKSLEEIEDLHAECVRHGWRYNMVMQYTEYEVSRAPERLSFYNYFRHGNDGLVWDCMQIIALARGEVALSEKSPYWECTINGQKLNFTFMDHAYVMHIQKWLAGALTQSMDDILEIHRKVHAFKERYEKH